MAEPGKVVGKTMKQINAQADRIFGSINNALANTRDRAEWDRLRARWDSAADAYMRYYDNVSRSSAYTRAIQRWGESGRPFSGREFPEYMENVRVPRSQYARRRNNRT